MQLTVLRKSGAVARLRCANQKVGLILTDGNKLKHHFQKSIDKERGFNTEQESRVAHDFLFRRSIFNGISRASLPIRGIRQRFSGCTGNAVCQSKKNMLSKAVFVVNGFMP
jgi:hypothetical protein